MGTEAYVYINPNAHGRITPQGLLHSEGTVELTLSKTAFSTNTVIFHIATEGFWFGLGFKDGNLVMQRNEHLLIVDASFLDRLPGNDVILASWTIDRMTFLLGPVGFQGPSISEWITMHPRPAPLSLFRWARKQSLIPKSHFNTESEFLVRVNQSLQLLQDKINQMHSLNVFWDIQYEGQKIVKRTPKRETDLHPIIQAMLSDQMFNSSIEVCPEFHTGVGNLDFLFIGGVKKKGQVRVCAEFKNAHSADLEHGLAVQLPAYMQNQKVEHGIYCILDYRGNWFNKPEIDNVLLYQQLGRASQRAHLPLTHPIKVHHLLLGKIESASKA